MENENLLNLNDVSDELLIIPKITIDKLFQLENCVDCVALYVFYYKTSKWQKTNRIKANDTYVCKCLKWGRDRTAKTKKILRENGLIDIIQKRDKNGKILGWYIEVKYLINKEKYEDAKLKIIKETSNHIPCEPQVLNTTSGSEDTNALKEYIKCLKKEIEVLKEENNTKDEEKDNFLYKEKFEKFYSLYPRKVGKVKVEDWFKRNNPNEELFKNIIHGLEAYNIKWSKDKTDKKYIPHPTSWLNAKRWEDEIDTSLEELKNSEGSDASEKWNW